MIFDRDDGVKIVAFGFGSVLISNVEFPDCPDVGISLTPTDVKEIGAKCNDTIGMTDEEIGAAITMSFPKVESINVMIESLETAKKTLISRLKK